MKYFYRIGLLCVLVLGIYFCYRYVAVLKPEFSFDSLIYSSERKAEKPLVIQNITVDDNGTVLEMTEDVKENYEEASAVPETLTCDTELVIREYDKSTRKEESYKESIPEQYIGKNRNQMEEIANSYTAAPSLKDLEKGFVSMEIASFSPEKLVVLKKYYSDLSKEHFEERLFQYVYEVKEDLRKEDMIEVCINGEMKQFSKSRIVKIQSRHIYSVMTLGQFYNKDRHTLETKEEMYRISLGKWMDILQDDTFYKVGRTFIVNLKYVRHITDNIVLETGEELVIPVRRRAEVKKTYNEYCLKMARILY